jgi:hypothetical protein
LSNAIDESEAVRLKKLEVNPLKATRFDIGFDVIKQ